MPIPSAAPPFNTTAEIPPAVGELYSAVASKQVNKVKDLLERGAAVDERNDAGITPLLLAAIKGYAEIVELLVDAGADVNTQSAIGETPLMRAAGYGSFEIVAFLIERGARLDTQAEDGRTALMYGAPERGKTDIVNLLILRGASLEMKNRNGETVVDIMKRLENASATGGTPQGESDYAKMVRVLQEAAETRRQAVAEKERADRETARHARTAENRRRLRSKAPKFALK